jgi:hypothetical protein
MNKQYSDLIKGVKQLINDTQDHSSSKWLRTNEAADYLGISITQLHVLKNQGVIPHSKLGGSLYFNKLDIDSILESNMVGGIDE